MKSGRQFPLAVVQACLILLTAWSLANAQEPAALIATLQTNPALVAPGAIVPVTLTVANQSPDATGPIEVRLHTGLLLHIVGTNSLNLDQLTPGQSVTQAFQLESLEGGRGWVSASLQCDGQRLLSNRAYVGVSGPGWYTGDCHTHSTHSDGRGTITENIASAQACGLSLLFATDHNTNKHWPSLEGHSTDDFLVLGGEEITTQKIGHCNAYFITETVSWDSDSNQRIIDDVKADGGLIFVNHPFSSKFLWPDWSITGLDGIEVWNGPGTPRSGGNQQAFEHWTDELNAGHHYVAIANSDAHWSNKIGNPRTAYHLPALTPENVRTAMESGAMYGTNGPDLRFEINGQSLGAHLAAAVGDDLTFTIRATADTPLETISIVRNGEVWLSWHPNRETASLALNTPMTEDAWYRLEIDAADNGFAFSNPIWVDLPADTQSGQ